MNKPLFIMPVIHEETTDACIRTIAKHFFKDLLLVDNSESAFASKYKDIMSVGMGENIGVGRAWNIGVRALFENSKYTHLVILSATMRFQLGLVDLDNNLQTHGNQFGLETQFGWHCIAIGKKTFEKVGLFDENFYPAYYEDSDFIRRMELAGIHKPMSKTERLPFREIHATTAGDAHAIKKVKVNLNMEACKQYFVEKWGCEPRYDSQESRDAMFTHPFNNKAFDLKYWPDISLKDLKQKYGIN